MKPETSRHRLLFVLKMETENETHKIDYFTMAQFFNDEPLKRLLDDKLVRSCVIYLDNKPVVASLPESLLDWDRLKDQVISNSASLLRAQQSKPTE